MVETNLWVKAQSINIKTPYNIIPGFNIGFDKKIPLETQEELRRFTEWVESNFSIPVTLWVDFEYKHYLIKRDGERVGYIFYWTPFCRYPIFENEDDIPLIRLPVRTEYSTIEEILTSFIEAITDYFAWICNEISPEFVPNDTDTQEILNEYLNSRK